MEFFAIILDIQFAGRDIKISEIGFPSIFQDDLLVEDDFLKAAASERIRQSEEHIENRFHRGTRVVTEIAYGSECFSAAPMSSQFFCTDAQFFNGTSGAITFTVRADLEAKINELMDGIVQSDLQKDERECTCRSFYVFFGTADAAGVDDGAIGTVEGFVGEDDIFFGKDRIGRFNFAPDGRYVPVIECEFPVNVLLNVITHA